MSSSAPTVALYRQLVPKHSEIGRDLVSTWLDLAIAAHTAAEWGDRYDEAMVWWAAHHLQRDHIDEDEAPGALVSVSETVTEGGRTYTKSRRHGEPAARPGEDAEFTTTRYGRRYLGVLATRAARAPYALGPG